MSYWHQMYRRPSERVEVENGAERFEALLAKELADKDRSFAQSLASQHEAKGNLSPKQVECFERMEQRYSEDAVKARKEWTAIYAAEHREIALIVAKYYRTTQYFNDLASNILLDKDFVPTQRQFEAITKNKYAKKAIATATEPPAFPAGALCLIRANYNLVGRRELHNQFGLVMENHPVGLHASSTLLVNGEKVVLQDRCLKGAQRKKKNS